MVGVDTLSREIDPKTGIVSLTRAVHEDIDVKLTSSSLLLAAN